MTKEKLIEIIQRLLRTETDDVDLSFLMKLSKSELDTLVSCIRYSLGVKSALDSFEFSA